MDPVAQRQLEILNAIETAPHVTQRGLARRLDVALGLANLYLKRLARKGYIKITTIPPNRVRYLLTPQGLAEKTRLTCDYMEYSLQLYRDTREALRAELAAVMSGPTTRVALYGLGEASELAYLTLRQLGLEPLAVFADAEQADFFGVPVRPVRDLATAEFDRLVVAAFGSAPDLALPVVLRLVPRERLILLGRPVADLPGLDGEAPPAAARLARMP